MKTLIILSIGLFGISYSYGQDILFLEGKKPGKAKIEDMRFIEGRWVGEMGGKKTEEVWSAPAAGQMMCMFRMYDENVNFYEFVTISEEDESLTLKIKHFNTLLKGWEEKDEYAEFKLVKMKKNTAYFDGFTFFLEGDTLSISLVVDEKEGKKESLTFTYNRAD